MGLVALGLGPKDVVSIFADNCPEWLYTDMGVLSVGGVTNGIYTTDSARQVEYIVNDSHGGAGGSVNGGGPVVALSSGASADSDARLSRIVCARRKCQCAPNRLSGLLWCLDRRSDHQTGLDALRTRAGVQSALRGVNAAVVGLLLAALYTPVWTSAIFAPADFALGVVAFLLLALWAVPPWLVVSLGAAGATIIANISWLAAPA